MAGRADAAPVVIGRATSGQRLVGGRGDLVQQLGVADQRGQLGGHGHQHADLAGRKTRGSTVCTTSTPCSAPPSTSGTPRNE